MYYTYALNNVKYKVEYNYILYSYSFVERFMFYGPELFGCYAGLLEFASFG